MFKWFFLIILLLALPSLEIETLLEAKYIVNSYMYTIYERKF